MGKLFANTSIKEERIDEMNQLLSKLQEEWFKRSDLRFFQFLCIYFSIHMKDVFYLEDSKVIEILGLLDSYEDTEQKGDAVNHPKHYTEGKYEVIDIIEGMNMLDFREANVLKYLFRYKYKNGVEDLKKARWYLDRLIQATESA